MRQRLYETKEVYGRGVRSVQVCVAVSAFVRMKYRKREETKINCDFETRSNGKGKKGGVLQLEEQTN